MKDTFLKPHAVYRMKSSNDVVMYLAGTTPVKNWKLVAHGLEGNAAIVLSPDNALRAIDALTFSLPVDNLKGEEAAMEERAHEALKSERFKNILFVLNNATIDKEGDGYLVTAYGKLTVAGVTKDVVLDMKGKVSSDGSIAFAGAQPVKMSDYNVERPSLLFGIIRADDEMQLRYSLVFTR
jgi:polyisoprenoid-binding protein YceI